MPNFLCQSCDFQQPVSNDYLGKKVKCPQCATISMVHDGFSSGAGATTAIRVAADQRPVSHARRWHSNPWILSGLTLLFSAMNVGMILGGIRLVVEYHLAGLR